MRYSPRALAGWLRRAATFLRKIGIKIGFDCEGRPGRGPGRSASLPSRTTPRRNMPARDRPPALGAAAQPDIHAYDHIDLPPINPVVTRINRHRGVCLCCHKRVAAPAPEGFEPSSPFGPGLCALIIHLHVSQAIGFERLARLLAEVFGRTISEGAIANILARAEAPLLAAVAPIAEVVRASPRGGCDETSARLGGKNWWQWVLLGSTAICHVIADTRAASVVTAFMAGARPEVWIGRGSPFRYCISPCWYGIRFTSACRGSDHRQSRRRQR